jgi:hypothetical protein
VVLRYRSYLESRQLSRLIRPLTRRGNLSAHGKAGTGLNSLRFTIP